MSISVANLRLLSDRRESQRLAPIIAINSRRMVSSMGQEHEVSDPAPARVVIDERHAVTGDRGRSVSGETGRAIAGDFGCAVVGDSGYAYTGRQGYSFAGDHGTAISGDRGVSIAGVGGVVRAGSGGVVVLSGLDQAGHRFVFAADVSDGSSGIEYLLPDTLYRLDGHTFVAATNIDGIDFEESA